MKIQKNNPFGSHYFKTAQMFLSKDEDQYSYKIYVGEKTFHLDAGDCCFYLSNDKKRALSARGKKQIKSKHFATIIRGYAPPEKTASIHLETNLPYVNGCSTRQIFTPERAGDPTWQMLKMPMGTIEQLHHIHPTARAVYVYQGRGISVVGTPTYAVKTELVPGMVCVLEPMCPHHFETTDSELIVLPVHIWSSTEGLDFNHPMFHGTLKA